MNKNIEINKETTDILDGFHFWPTVSLSCEKIEHIVSVFKTLLREGMKELINIFTNDEIIFLLNGVTSLDMITEYSIKNLLVTHVADQFRYESLVISLNNLDVSYEALMIKVNELTEFQSYCLLYSLNRFLDIHPSSTFDEIKEVYGTID